MGPSAITDIGILWLSFSNSSSAKEIEERLQDGKEVSRVIDASIPLPFVRDAALVSFEDNTIAGVASVKIGSKQGVGQKRVTIESMDFLAKPLPVPALKAAINSRLRRFLSQPKSDVSRISPKLWKNIYEIRSSSLLKGMPLDLYAKNRIKNWNWKFATRDPSHVQVADANLLSAEIFGGRAARTSLAGSNGAQGKGLLESVIDGDVNLSRTIEDRIIEYDSDVFPGYSLVAKHITGIRKLEGSGRSLYIVNANRSGIERNTGVDLVYYNSLYHSYVLVQYKNMASEVEGEACYRPSMDKSFDKELNTMRRLRDSLVSVPRNLLEYRILSDPFYFKFCEPRVAGPIGDELAQGIYLPLGIVEVMLSSGECLGPSGGKNFGWGNCLRRFNNSNFSTLVRSGWTGTLGDDSKTIEKILHSSLGVGKHVVTAYEVTERDGRDRYLRDSHGRFTADDDPDGMWSDIPF